MLRFVLPIFLGLSATTLFAQQSESDFCEILDLQQNVIGVATVQGKIARYRSGGNPAYEVIGISFANDSLKKVGTYDRYLVLEDMGRTNISGEIFDYADNYLGRITEGSILNVFANVVGYYRGCDHIQTEFRNSLIAAAASRLIVFDFNRHIWEYRFFNYCDPQHICRW